MARKKTTSPKKYSGGRKIVPGVFQAEVNTGRDQNVAGKNKFRVGPHARTDPNAGSSQRRINYINPSG